MAQKAARPAWRAETFRVAARAPLNIEPAIAYLLVAKSQVAALTRNSWRVVREENRKTSLLGRANKQHRYRSRECMHVYGIRTFLIQDFCECRSRSRITVTVELVEYSFSFGC
jgi:hypothetical protein